MPIVRARDLRSNIREMGFEKGVVHTLELALEDSTETRQHLREATEIIQMLVDQVEKLVAVGSGMRDKLDQMQRDKQQGEINGDQV